VNTVSERESKNIMPELRADNGGLNENSKALGTLGKTDGASQRHCYSGRKLVPVGLCRRRPKWPAVRHNGDDSGEDELPDHAGRRDIFSDELCDLEGCEVNC
jgi:hypothetical protein